MTQISTVTGTISPEELGVISVHEHVKPVEGFRRESLDFQVRDLLRAKALGLSTVVDLTPDRDVEFLKTASERSGVRIIPCTGHDVSFTDEERTYSADRFYGIWANEVEHGIGNTGIRPGAIKTASAHTVPEGSERIILEAAGRLQRDTGLPLFVHSCTGCQNHQAILEEAGADLSRVCFSHVEARFGWEGRSLAEQTDLLEALVKKGSFINYNNFGNWAHTEPTDLLHLIKEMIRRGYPDKQFATMDAVLLAKDGQMKVLWEDINPDGRDRMYSYLLREALPWMERHGVAKEDARKMVCDNAVRLFR